MRSELRWDQNTTLPGVHATSPTQLPIPTGLSAPTASGWEGSGSFMRAPVCLEPSPKSEILTESEV